MSKKKNSKLGNVSVNPEDFKDENVRVQISIKIPMDLLKAYRAEALKQKKGYQTLMQETLRNFLPFIENSKFGMGMDLVKSQLSPNEVEAIRFGLKKLEDVEHRIHTIESKLPKLKRA